MAWHIRTATADEKAVRRAALDFFGALTVFGCVVAAVVVCLCTAAYRANFSEKSGTWRRRVYLADWWLGRRRGWAFGGIFTAVAVLIVTVGTGDDYFHLTKRASHTAAALLPAQYILSSRFILQRTALLSHQTHETLNAAHRFLGRAIYTLLCLHAALYLTYFARLRPDRLFYWDAIFGLLGLGIMTAVFITSLPAYRRRFYRRFVGLHTLLTLLVLPVAWFHVPYVRRYVFASGCIVAVDRVGRYLSTVSTKLRVTYVSSTALDVRDEGDGRVLDAAPGSHFYIHIPGSRGNPFTAAGSGRARFLVRIRGGFTRELAEAADGSVAAMLEGPYGVCGTFPGHAFDGYLFVAGGVGVTAAFAVLRGLISRMDGGKKVRFVWAVRDVEDAAWPLDELLRAGSTPINVAVDIYITRSSGTTPSATDVTSGEGVEMEEMGKEEEGLLEGDAREDNSRDKRDTAAAVESLRRLYARTPVQARIIRGRPDAGRIAGEFCDGMEGRRAAVMVCGPEGMAGDVRRGICARGGHRRALVWLWEEKFSL
ncbi:hypothetical protein TWF696_003192 [Orbilia brochopaga]|uniref:FAD-binding FR-type domain-containing protein n=1 Tax=Orbilia brochopaga TaxID=3140254 RepID=A0AAV9TZZ5_9PEZI